MYIWRSYNTSIYNISNIIYGEVSTLVYIYNITYIIYIYGEVSTLVYIYNISYIIYK